MTNEDIIHFSLVEDYWFWRPKWSSDFMKLSGSCPDLRFDEEQNVEQERERERRGRKEFRISYFSNSFNRVLSSFI